VLPNPSVVVEHQRNLTGEDEHETIAGLEVDIGLGGSWFVRQNAAEARRDAAVAEADAMLLEHALSFREAYVRAVGASGRVAVLEEQQAALDALHEVIAGLAKGGEAAGYDLLRNESQARIHRRRVIVERARARASRRLLEGWLGAPVTLPPADLGALAGGAALRERARAEPGAVPARVVGLEAAAEAARLEAEAAERRAVPDLGVFAGYRTVTSILGTGHGFAIAVAVPLTFFDHGQGEAALAEARRDVALAEASQLRTTSAAEAVAAAEELAVLEGATAELDAAVNDAESLQDEARTLYRAGELSIAGLLDALDAAEQVRLARIDHAEEVALARLRLMRAHGRQFDAALDAACGTRRAGTRR
jgi:cobalt-zinc-cadmium efflux system outer membrane protein